ncbi:F-box/LRR-repeat protein 3 [Centruroides vittatus]|uniref:F-box/LRR-repeat protein 3 n=1 Tax=Centruroides vittatus TaxID=120091 RepID=UPI0035101B85
MTYYSSKHYPSKSLTTYPRISLPSRRRLLTTTTTPSATTAVNEIKTDKETKKKKTKERKKKEPPKPVYWEYLPDILLEDIFSYLSISQRHTASQVCPNWFRIFSSPNVWRTFVLDDRTLTRRKFNYYLGYQYILDHQRTQICLHRVGRAIRTLIFRPIPNFFNLYEFMSIVTYFCEFFDENPMCLVKNLHFRFACDSASNSSEEVFGTGGRLLQALKRLMKNLIGLRYLSLQDLLLDTPEAMFLLDDVVQNCSETLRTLRIVNCTKVPYAFMHVGVFLNLKTLIVSPQHLSDDIVILLGHTKLVDLYILQVKHTDVATPVSRKTWKECRKISPKLRVHLVIDGKVKTEVMWQEGAPIRSIIYKTPYNRITVQSALTAATMYTNDLECYAFIGIPRFYMPKPFQERGDSPLVLLCRNCPNIKTLVIRERVSTATVLLMAFYCKNIETFIVRRNAIIKRCDWPRNPDWTDEFYSWLKTASQSYESTAKEVSSILGRAWKPIGDQEFKLYRINSYL